MFEPFAPAIDAFAKLLARNYRELFGRTEPDHVPVLRATARLALERIAGTDALYHDALHTLFVTDVGQAILRGRAMVEPVSRECWLHLTVATLLHDVGYLRGVCPGDGDRRHLAGAARGTVAAPRGATDAFLAPWHVERGRLFVRRRCAAVPGLDVERLCGAIELTRCPVPEDRDLERDRPRRQLAALPLAPVTGAEVAQPDALRRRRGRPAADRQREAGVRVRADPRQGARRGLEREAGGRPGLEEGQPAQRLPDRVEVGPPVRPPPLAHAPEHEQVVERVEGLRAVVADGADPRRDVEVDRDQVVHRRLVAVVALRAAEAAADGAQAGEALDRAGAARADQEPVGLEQAERGGVQQQVDRLVRVEVALGRQRERVDTEQGRVLA